MPLTVGIDHVVIHLSHSERSAPAISAVRELAAEYGLVIWDPQSRDAYLPGGEALSSLLAQATLTFAMIRRRCLSAACLLRQMM
jgi:hypothetical protein